MVMWMSFFGIGSGPVSSDYTTEELDECLRDLPIGFETGQFYLHQRWTEKQVVSGKLENCEIYKEINPDN